MSQEPGTSTSNNPECPVCLKCFPTIEIESHVNRCLFLSSAATETEIGSTPSENKRSFGIFKFNRKSPGAAPVKKKQRLDLNNSTKLNGSSGSTKEVGVINLSDDETIIMKKDITVISKKEETIVTQKDKLNVPLAEKMRPNVIEEYVGQNHIMDKNTVLRSVLNTNEIPSMILWGPPGCGKVYNFFLSIIK